MALSRASNSKSDSDHGCPTGRRPRAWTGPGRDRGQALIELGPRAAGRSRARKQVIFRDRERPVVSDEQAQTDTPLSATLAAVSQTLQRRRQFANCVLSVELAAAGVLLLGSINGLRPLREIWAFGAVAGVLLLAVGIALLKWVLVATRPSSPKELALVVEQTRPELMDSLVAIPFSCPTFRILRTSALTSFSFC